MADRGSFHLGKSIDSATGKPGADDLVIGSNDLTNNGVIVGRLQTENDKARVLEGLRLYLRGPLTTDQVQPVMRDAPRPLEPLAAEEAARGEEGSSGERARTAPRRGSRSAMASAETIDTVAIRLEASDVRITDVRLVWVPVD